MDKKTFSKEEFEEMVAQLESEFYKIMKSEQEESAQRLAKSENEAKEEKYEKKEEEEKKEEPKAEAKEESKEEPKAEAKEESKEEDKKDKESHGYDDEDLEEMHKMYSSMSKAEREAHKSAIEKCGEMSKMMVKSEDSSSDEAALLKSEVAAIKKENEELKKNIEGLVSAMNAYVTKKAPARKAITEIEFVKKSEEGREEKPLTKAEVDKILAKKVSDPSLSRSDREAINSFYLTNAGVEKIAHLLKQ